MKLSAVLKDYLEKGWGAPLPLRTGSKFPPPKGTTGGAPELTRREVVDLWKENGSANSNLGLRLQSRIDADYDIVALDVDHHGDEKTGYDTLIELEEKFGSLDRDNVPHSNRRGADNPGGHWFFRVPKGLKFASTAGSGIDILQLKHRYAVVWPSVVDGMEYKWYLGSEEIGVPSVDDLPELPEAWVNHLIEGATGKKFSNRTYKPDATVSSTRSAKEWLRDNIPGFAHDEPSAPMKKLYGEDYLTNLKGNAHDTMVSAVHAAVQLGAEGHNGLKAALFNIEKEFKAELKDRRPGSRESEQAVDQEWASALVGEVKKTKALVDDGELSILEVNENLALPHFRENLKRDESTLHPKA